ncbi:MAG: hypothetical protein JSU96_19695 [Acidobacteriota bacterium]|nr:MAG: hypothetical protein JSU96_19695 [Acidobacteriota bacterium]
MSSGRDSTRVVPVAVIGPGRVGRELLHRLIKDDAYYRSRYGLEFRVTSVCDSTQGISRPVDGFRKEDLESIIAIKREGGSLTDFSRESAIRTPSFESIAQQAEPGLIAIDCTASEETTPLLLKLIKTGGRVVLANKKPLVGELSVFKQLTASPAACRWETTVASCLPIISILNRMTASGDHIASISGVLSGTMSYLMTQIEQGERFSESLQRAMKLGYTEPDPREDLLGHDQARKALILARTAGWDLDLSKIKVVPLLPGPFCELGRAEFLQRLPELDRGFLEKTRECGQEGAVLRHGVEITPDRGTVELMEVASQSPIGRLLNNNNLVQVESRTFSNPLVVQGRGAGAAATAAGNLSDLVELAFTRSEDQLQEQDRQGKNA